MTRPTQNRHRRPAPRRFVSKLVTGAILVSALASAAGFASAQDGLPELRTNESDITAATRPGRLAIDDPVAVFAYVLGRLPERVRVYPTENYYYFKFVHNGVPYAGNIRLAVAHRDDGVVHFAYGEELSDWNDDPPSRHAALGAAQGVKVERVSRLIYRVSLDAAHGGRSITFALNDLARHKPPAGLLVADEGYIGPVFDESGLRFFLVFNTRLKVFHYLLDETEPVPEGFAGSKDSDRILIGKRTGFAFYRDGTRKVLIGVSGPQSRLNTAFDGPFDQLPENFIEGETLREAIVAADPRTRGKIDRLGHYTDGKSRYLIHPFMPYWDIGDLAVFHRCVTAKSVPPTRRPLCFVIDNDESQRTQPLPRALKRR
jgi:hypothetical protein